MSLISTDNLSLTLKAISKLLSFKANKSEVIDRGEIPDEIEFVAKMELISAPVVADDGSIYTDENGVIYTL